MQVNRITTYLNAFLPSMEYRHVNVLSEATILDMRSSEIKLRKLKLRLGMTLYYRKVESLDVVTLRPLRWAGHLQDVYKNPEMHTEF